MKKRPHKPVRRRPFHARLALARARYRSLLIEVCPATGKNHLSDVLDGVDRVLSHYAAVKAVELSSREAAHSPSRSRALTRRP